MGKEGFELGMLLYDTERALKGDITPVATIQVNSADLDSAQPRWYFLGYDVSPNGKYLLFEMGAWVNHIFLFEMPSGKLIKNFRLSNYGGTRGYKIFN